MVRSKQNQNSTVVQRQKRVLGIMYVICFIISFAVVVAESVYYKEPVKIKPNQESVAGAKIGRDFLLDAYRQEAAKAAAAILGALESASAEKELDASYEELLAARVPDLYQDLHLKLVRIFALMATPDFDDIRPASSAYEELADEYPWLEQ